MQGLTSDIVFAVWRRHLRAVRIERGVTQEDLAASIGVEQSFLSKVERGWNRFGPAAFDAILAIADRFDLTLSDLAAQVTVANVRAARQEIAERGQRDRSAQDTAAA